jgi:hypothetical protein
MKKLLILFAIVALGGCRAKTFATAQEVEDAFKCETDDFSGLTTCNMQEKLTCSHDGSDWNCPSSLGMGGVQTFSNLVIIYKNKNDATFAINGSIFGFDWSFPEYAKDKDGRNLSLNKIDSNVSCSGSVCSHYEYFTIKLDKKYLTKHKNTGISIKIYGKRGNSQVELPAVYVQGLLNFMKNDTTKEKTE